MSCASTAAKPGFLDFWIIYVKTLARTQAPGFTASFYDDEADKQLKQQRLQREAYYGPDRRVIN